MAGGKKSKKGKQKASKAVPVGMNVANEKSTGGGREGTCGYLTEATPGCHVAFYDAPWILGVDPLHVDDFGDGIRVEDIPDISLDMQEGVLSAINTSASSDRSIFMTVELEKEVDGHREVAYVLRTAAGADLSCGMWTNSDGQQRKCVTLVAVLHAMQVMDLCYVDVCGTAALTEISITSDVKDMPKRRQAGKEAAAAECLAFPLKGTYHALDFRCPVGTPVIAVGDGTITEVRQENSASGIHTENLFLWNSVTLQLEGSGRYVEYVHIERGSVTKQVGDRIAAGQVLCRSGAVGFCPEPHLHIQVHDSADHDAPTVPFSFIGSATSSRSAASAAGPFVPRAGDWCCGVSSATFDAAT